MKIGITAGSYIKTLGPEAGLARIKELGYDCLDFGYLANTEGELFQVSEGEFERRLRKFAAMSAAAGLEISQTHGPWRWPCRDYTIADRAERFEKMSKSIRGTAYLGCKNMVIHEVMPFGGNYDPDPQLLWDINLEYMSRLTEVGKEHGVVVNFENMPFVKLSLSYPEPSLRMAEAINSPFFKLCLDTGHCMMTRVNPADAVRLWGKEYLSTLHVHDNEGLNDKHWAPGMGVIDWADFAAALQEIGYEGSVSLECNMPLKGGTPEGKAPYTDEELVSVTKKLAGR